MSQYLESEIEALKRQVFVLTERLRIVERRLDNKDAAAIMESLSLEKEGS